jgi:phospholipase A1
MGTWEILMSFLYPLARGIGATTVVLAAFYWQAAGAADSPDVDTCLLEAIGSATASTTVAELRRRCESGAADTGEAITEKPVKPVPVYERQSALDERMAEEAGVEGRPFVITPSRPNYILWTMMDNANQAPFEEALGIDDPLQDDEMQFQVSIKAPVWRNMFGTNLDTYVAYHTRSYWQLFNDDLSSPFRETNYEPEIYVRGALDYDLLGVNIARWSLGFNHQSNGRGDPLSRSWNRIMGQTLLAVNDDLGLLVRAWYRIPEDDEDDDNPGMHRYLGYGDIRAVWTPNRNTFTAMIRPGTDKAGFELTWSYPLNRVFRIYTQYYSGYGESLIDYDADIERISIGIALNDYLQRF